MRFGKSCWRRSLRKDGKFLLSIVDPNIQISFGGEEGIRAFRELWKPEDVNSEIWNTLAQLLRLGGTFGESRNEFLAPVYFQPVPGRLWRLRFFSNHRERRKGEERSKRQGSNDYVSVLRHRLESFRQRFTRAPKQDGPCLGSHSSSRRSGGFR